MKSVLLVLSVVRSSETRALISNVADHAGHKLLQPTSCRQAEILLNNGVEPDLVIFEASASDTGYDLRELVRLAAPASISLVCGQSELRLKKIAEELGVTNIIDTPLVERELIALFECALRPNPERNFAREQALEELHELRSQPPAAIEELGDGRYFLAASPSMLKIHRQVHLLADVDAPVLILGESGTGKEVIAHLIHKHSRRAAHSFVNVNCAALPADLLESELFGYRRGAFTGAIKDKPGKFEFANGGTLLLDEIGEMSAQMQAKLLHVLQDGQFNRLGARESSKVNVRVLAATNVQIEDALVGKTFREDLYYRLNVFTINVPPLRERREEIPYLVDEIVRRSPAELQSVGTTCLSSRLMDAMLQHSWRGNVRELRNFITRTLTMRDEAGAIQELEKRIAAGRMTEWKGRSAFARSEENPGMRSAMREITVRAEAQMIQDALEVNGWNRRRAARSLNISYRGLLYKIQQHRLAPSPLMKRL
ncbi:MAG: sigma-54-dependent Fis family transcriptional regulator [Acidobacteria bacterium]|nr:sigma-54-dependent Fis family transcriptional regulator [Acidobacteriota bacterium]